MTRLALGLALAFAIVIGIAWAALAAPARPDRATLRLYIWSEYIDPGIVADFERRARAKVEITTYESNEEMLEGLRRGGLGTYDLVVPSDNAVPGMIREGLLQPLDHAKIPNLRRMTSSFRSIAYDPGNRYTVAYQWGTTGLAYRKDRVKGLEPTWAVLFDPKRQPGPFVLIDSPRDMLGIALKYLGQSVNARDPRVVRLAGRLVAETARSPRSLGIRGGVEAKNELAAGRALVAVVYSGDAIKAAEESPDIAYVVPVEGTVAWVDNLAVAAGAPNAALAHRFIDFVLTPAIGARLSNFNRYATPNAASLPLVDPADRNHPGIYPPPHVMQKLEFIQELGADSGLYDEVWAGVVAR